MPHWAPDPAQHVLDVARELLGARVVSTLGEGAQRVVVRLTEVEAYGGQEDPGSHAARGQTRRNAVMFGPPGRLYVYFTYGMHWCANVVCGPEGTASAVLLRAGEVVEGAHLAASRRPACRRPVDLARGPARLATALGLSGAQDGLDLTSQASPVWLEPGPGVPVSTVRTGPRVGVAGPGGDGVRFPWRLWSQGEATVSPYRAAVARRRT
ncbi:MAG: DNA-3-methyladenine glycosylase [Kineosporiaceae bacterium]